MEDSDPDFIRRMIAEGHATDDDTAVHDGQLVWKEGAAIHHPDDDASGSRRRVLFQLVPEPKTVKNRVHLDVLVGADRLRQEVERLRAMGATVSHEGQQGPNAWVTMQDPQGNEFCVA